MKTNERKELHHKTSEELQKMLMDARKELVTARLSHTRGKLKNPRSLMMIRRNIAQVLSVLRRKELLTNENA